MAKRSIRAAICPIGCFGANTLPAGIDLFMIRNQLAYQLRFDFPGAQSVRARPCDNQKVVGRLQFSSVLPKNFSYTTLHTVPSYGTPDFTGYGNPKSGLFGAPRNINNNEVPRSLSPVLALNLQEFPAFSDSYPRWEGAFSVDYRFARFAGVDTVSRLRPFARLALITLRPPGLAMRARNPWRRRRFTLLG